MNKDITPANVRRIFIMKCLGFVLAFTPAIWLGVLMCRNAVNIPFWDEWSNDIAGIFEKYKMGTLTLGDLWAQHNEVRLFLPRIFFLLLGNTTHWNVCYEMAATFFLACFIAVAVFRLARSAFADKPKTSWAIFFLSNLLIFSPIQWEAWLWGMEVILYVPLACILSGLLIIRSRAADGFKWFACAALAMISTYSFSNGLLTWIVLFPALFLSNGLRLISSKKQSAFWWLLGFVGNLVLYFHNYKFPNVNGFWQTLWNKPIFIIEYFFAFLGAPLAGQHLGTAIGLGVAWAILFGANCLFLFKVRKNNTILLPNALPWLTLGGYSILSDCLAVLCRSGLPLTQAISSRYGIFPIVLIVAVIHLTALNVFAYYSRKEGRKPQPSSPYPALTAFGVYLIAWYVLALPDANYDFYVCNLDRLEAKSCLAFINILPPQTAAMKLTYDYPQVKRMANSLVRLGVRNDWLFASSRLADFKISQRPDESRGGIESCQELAGEKYDLKGWAEAANGRKPADCVLFTYEGEGIDPTVFGLMDGRMSRPDIVAKYRNKNLLLSGWEKICPLTDLPKGVLKIRAWAYDAATHEITLLDGEGRVLNESKE